MRSAYSCMLWLLMATSVTYAQEPKTDVPDLSKFDLTKETDRKVFGFCQCALLRPRGLTSSPFAGSSDRWIMENLLPNDRFLAELDASDATSIYVAEQKEGEQSARDPDRAIVDHYQKRDGHSDKLLAKLTPERLGKLPGVYLHVEGLIALCRPEFSKLFENADTQERIRKLAQEAWQKRASELHRSLFGLQTDHDAPFLEVDIRKVSYELDLRIAALLTEKERERLASLISKSWNLHRTVQGAPAY